MANQLWVGEFQVKSECECSLRGANRMKVLEKNPYAECDFGDKRLTKREARRGEPPHGRLHVLYQ